MNFPDDLDAADFLTPDDPRRPTREPRDPDGPRYRVQPEGERLAALAKALAWIDTHYTETQWPTPHQL